MQEIKTENRKCRCKIDQHNDLVSEPDPLRGGGGKGLGTILHSSCPQVGMLT